jgi:hypothetical protein
VPRLAALKRDAEFRYAAVIGWHGRLFEERWLEGGAEAGDAELLGAPEISAVADAAAVYQGVESLRAFPIGAKALAPFALLTLLPFLPVIATEIPLKDLLRKILSALL